MSNVIDFLQKLGQVAEPPRGPRPQLPLSVIMAPGKKEADEDEEEDDLEDEDEDEDEDDFDDDDEDEDDEDEDEDEDDEDEDDGEENSLTPRRSPLRRVA